MILGAVLFFYDTVVCCDMHMFVLFCLLVRTFCSLGAMIKAAANAVAMAKSSPAPTKT